MSDTALSPRVFGKVRSSFLSQKQGDVSVLPNATASPTPPTVPPETIPPQPNSVTLSRFGSQSPKSLASLSSGPKSDDKTKNQESIDLFEKILGEVESTAPEPPADSLSQEPAPVAGVVPTQDLTQTESTTSESAQSATVVPQQGSTHKENLAVNQALAVESATAPVVEFEVAPEKPEISPEVSSFLEHVENHQEQLPQEIVIADAQQMVMPPKPIAQPVIVLPMTQEEEKAGEGKSVTWSVRWLVEWSRKIMKIFSGKVIYREEPKEEVAV
jgi:hypothetical protein